MQDTSKFQHVVRTLEGRIYQESLNMIRVEVVENKEYIVASYIDKKGQILFKIKQTFCTELDKCFEKIDFYLSHQNIISVSPDIAIFNMGSYYKVIIVNKGKDGEKNPKENSFASMDEAIDFIFQRLSTSSLGGIRQ